jgi:hypothetical protein
MLHKLFKFKVFGIFKCLVLAIFLIVIFIVSFQTHKNIFNVEYFIQTASSNKTINEEKVRKFPEVLLIGGQKCGTGALITYLKFHPNLITPSRGYYFTKYFHLGLNEYELVSVFFLYN